MPEAPDRTTSDTVPAKPGILFVSSIVLHPSALDPHDFCDWYENTHIQQVQSTGGISSTQRYESISFIRTYRQEEAKSETTLVKNRNFNYDFLTIYNMPDLAFRESEAFRGLDGQSKPSDELLNKVFKQTEFLTRFYEELEIDGSSAAGTPPPFIMTVGVSVDHSIAKFPPTFSKTSSHRRVKKYKLHEASILSEFQRSYVFEPSEMSIYEFDHVPDTSELLKELLSVNNLEVGLWQLKRDYDGSERTPAGWKPK